MSSPNFWDEPLPTEMLSPPNTPLSNECIELLWSLFGAIGEHWRIDIEVDLFRSRWLDMIEARCDYYPDYRGEYINAADVYKALVADLGRSDAIVKVYKETIVVEPEQATTRLGHAKFYVANDFIRFFVATGGFRGFVPEARNYTGYMGGSRFREWPPVRTGARS